MIWVAETAVIAGNVAIAKESSVWHHAVLRGDSDAIVIGSQSNIQDGVVAHADTGKPTRVGNRVTVGHRAVIHGCTIGDESVIGMGAIITSGAVIGDHSFVGAGAVVPEGMKVPPRSVVLGVPGKVAKLVSPVHVQRMKQSWKEYIAFAKAQLPQRPDLKPQATAPLPMAREAKRR